MASNSAGPSAPAPQRDPYEVLGVSRDSTDQEIKASYRKLALKYHPDKNANNPEASELFKEVSYSHSILADPEKRRQYDISGFQSLDAGGMDKGIDLSKLGTVNKMFAALFSKLGVPIKTTVSANVLDEALRGNLSIRPLPMGTSVSGKVYKQCAHFFWVRVNDEEAEAGVVIRVYSGARSKFKLLYFDQCTNNSYTLALQEESEKTGNVTSAGMYFLRFQVYRMDPTIHTLAMAKDPKAAFFKRLEGLLPCEISELKAGTHVFAVYGDNFFRTASYTIEAVCANSYRDQMETLKEVEYEILRKRRELREFEKEYRKVLVPDQAVSNRCSQEKQAVDELLKRREAIRSAFTVTGGRKSNDGSGSTLGYEILGGGGGGEEGSWDGRDEEASKKKWWGFPIIFKGCFFAVFGFFLSFRAK